MFRKACEAHEHELLESKCEQHRQGGRWPRVQAARIERNSQKQRLLVIGEPTAPLGRLLLLDGGLVGLRETLVGRL